VDSHPLIFERTLTLQYKGAECPVSPRYNMSVITIEATVENGQIRLPPATQLPEKATVYIVIPDSPGGRPIRIMSPRDFKLTMSEQAK
jgi:hypothetical protein